MLLETRSSSNRNHWSGCLNFISFTCKPYKGDKSANVITGLPRKNRGSIGTAIVKVFDLPPTSTGLSKHAVQALGYKHAVVHTTGKDHASYYPGATEIVLKLIFSPTDGKIFGARAACKERD